jgi:Rho-binding antiterminator
MASDYTPIDCDLHDYVEIACMRRYRVRISTADEVMVGIARTTLTDADKQEWLVVDHGGASHKIRLDKIRSLEPLDHDAQFALIRFTARSENRTD